MKIEVRNGGAVVDGIYVRNVNDRMEPTWTTWIDDQRVVIFVEKTYFKEFRWVVRRRTDTLFWASFKEEKSPADVRNWFTGNGLQNFFGGS